MEAEAALIRGYSGAVEGWQDRGMRITLQARSLQTTFPLGNNAPLSVTIKPANNVAGSFDFETSSHALLKLLRQKTDMSDAALDLFHQGLRFSSKSRIPAVTLRDEVLEEIGYFIE